MGSKLMNCPTCSHSVNTIAGACPYCGANMSQEAQHPQSDVKEVVQNELAEAPQSPLPPEEALSDAELATDAETDSANESVSEKKESEFQTLDDERKLKLGPEFEELTLDDDSESEIALALTDGPPSVPDTEAENTAEVKPDMQGPESDKTSAFTSIDPIAEQQEAPSEFAADEIPLQPEPKVVELAVDEPGESETLRENIVEMTEIETSQQELDTQLTSETSPPPDETGEAAEIDSANEFQPKIEADMATDKEAGISSDPAGDTIVLEAADDKEAGISSDPAGDTMVLEAAEDDEAGVSSDPAGAIVLEAADDDEAGVSSDPAGDTIVLEATDEVQPSTRESSDKIEETAKWDSPAEALKIEKAAQIMAAAIAKQKAALAQSQKIKKQKAALAKSQALKLQKADQVKVQTTKKQKMILAKAAALKRKKAALAKAQALKKQRNAQAGIELAQKDDIAAAADTPVFVQNLEANTQMQRLLEKYKGQAIGINYDNSAEIREAQLVEANGEFFRVFVQDENLHYSYPLKTILTVIEGKYGVDASDSGKTDKFNAVIKVYPLIPF